MKPKSKESTIQTGLLTRQATFDRSAAKKETRTIPLSFSSELPVERWFGTEILDHDPKSIRSDRYGKGLAFLMNHSRENQIGIAEDISFQRDRKGRGLARFGKSAAAEEILQDVLDGIRKDVSVGYQIHKMVLEKEEEDMATYRATDWEPLEVSIVAVPADISVGIGRGEGTDYEIEIQNEGAKKMKCSKCGNEVADGASCPVCNEKNRVMDILTMGEKSGLTQEAHRFISAGKSSGDFGQLLVAEARKKLEPISVGQDMAETKPFRSFAEYAHAVRYEPGDPRFRALSAERILGERAMSMGVGSAGGFEASWIGEGTEKPATNLFVRMITLEPKEVAATLVCTDKLLRNWSSGLGMIERMARDTIIDTEEMAFISGNGVAKPLGFLDPANSAAIQVNRSGGANTIVWQDVYIMFNRVLRTGGNPIWLASSTCLSQLIRMKDDASSLVWAPSARDQAPNILLGYPIYICNRLPGLGSRGDLCLVNLSYYAIKDGSGPFFAASEHVYFASNKTVFKIFWNVDGQSLLREPIPLERSSTNTVSPFMILV